MKRYSEVMWQKRVNRQYQLNGFSEAPIVSTKKLKFPAETNRKQETLILSLFYPNNLFNSFLHRFDKTRFPTSSCSCGQGLQDSLHLLQDCKHVNSQMRVNMKEILSRNPRQFSMLHDCSFLITWSRNSSFIKICTNICRDCQPFMRSEIVL